MRLTLPGGAILDDRRYGGDTRRIACRPQTAVEERVRTHQTATRSTGTTPKKDVSSSLLDRKRLSKAKLLVEVLIAIVTLIGLILGLLGLKK
jgi:hypothetical protein